MLRKSADNDIVLRCDRKTPCEPCIKSNQSTCVYVYDRGHATNAAPFSAEDTLFSVFEQIPLQGQPLDAGEHEKTVMVAEQPPSTPFDEQTFLSALEDPACDDANFSFKDGIASLDLIDSMDFMYHGLMPHGSSSIHGVEEGVATMNHDFLGSNGLLKSQSKPITLGFDIADTSISSNTPERRFSLSERYYGPSNWKAFAHEV
jgi:hypothetical protein